MEAEVKTKRCPYCDSEILATAKKCKYCDAWLDSVDDLETETSDESYDEEPECIIFQTKSHWMIFFPWLLSSVLCGLCLYLLSTVLPGSWISVSVLVLLGIACFILGFESVSRLILFFRGKYMVSSKAVIIEKASFFGQMIERQDVSDILGVAVTESSIKEATVTVLMKDGKVCKYMNLKNPMGFKEAIESQMEVYK